MPRSDAMLARVGNNISPPIRWNIQCFQSLFALGWVRWEAHHALVAISNLLAYCEAAATSRRWRLCRTVQTHKLPAIQAMTAATFLQLHTVLILFLWIPKLAAINTDALIALRRGEGAALGLACRRAKRHQIKSFQRNTEVGRKDRAAPDARVRPAKRHISLERWVGGSARHWFDRVFMPFMPLV